MKKCLLLFFLLFSSTVFSNPVETIIIIRHAEKTPIEIGQLSCEGLNRSLKLPHFFETNFGKPDFIFAPNPSVQIARNANEKFSYVRALASIEPTAIYFTLPVDTQIGFNQPEKLMKTLLDEKYHDKKIIVSWESQNINKLSRLLLSHFNQKNTFEDIQNHHFDRVFVFTIDWNQKPAALSFSQMRQNIKNINKNCLKCEL